MGVGVYSYRALKQMDEDWEDYYEKLDEYRRATGIDPEAATTGEASSGTKAGVTSAVDEMTSLFKGGTLAIDLGTSKLKLAHMPSASNANANAKPTVSVDREGARSTPSLVWMSSDDEVLVGRMAESRLFDSKGGNIFRPRDVLASDSGSSDTAVSKAVQQSIRMAASNALEQVLGGHSSQSTSPLFVVDESMAYSGAYNVRPVFTYPTSSGSILSRYKNVIQSLTSPEGIGKFVPEPLAIVTGAEYYKLIPANTDPVLVVDVGGSTTNISVVSNDEVAYSSSFPFGGDTFVDLLTNHLIRGFYGTEGSHESISTKPTLEDPSAVQRLYEASTTALHELSNKSRSQINIPYLSIDLQTKQPKHLDVGVARSIVDTEVETYIRDKLVDFLSNEDSVLSASMPKPTDLSTLFSSTIASAMERTAQTPFSLRSVLLVGGGSRIPLVRQAMKRAVGQVGGDMFAERLVVPDGEMAEELAVLGAALCGGSDN